MQAATIFLVPGKWLSVGARFIFSASFVTEKMNPPLVMVLWSAARPFS
jgi:hypothetical protein